MSSTSVERNIDQPTLEVASTYLLDFFGSGGRSVLVRGDPGTGKTSLVLQLLDYHSKNNFKCVYMSTRLSAKTLKSHQPWIEIVQGKYGTVPHLTQDQIGFQDSRRMDGVRAISSLRTYLEQFTNPFVVLDSWEGLFFESHALGVEEISKLVEDYDARFVVVTERREQTDLDYLLDGVIVLRRKFHEGRIVREIELKKLRGVSIKQSRFLFTLDQGKFRYLPSLSSLNLAPMDAVGSPIPSTKPKLCSTGSLAMDSMLQGGIKESSVNLVELSDDVPFEVTSLYLRTVLSNFINNGHKVVFLPFVGFDRARLEAILPNLSTKTLEDSVTILEYGKEANDSGESRTIGRGTEKDLALLNSTVPSLKKELNKPLLLVVSEEALEGLYGVETASRYLIESISICKQSGNIGIQIARSGSRLLAELKIFSDTHLKFEMIHGTALAYAVKPVSVLHGVMNDPVASGRLHLVPIV